VAELIPSFDQVAYGSGTVTSETWIDLLAGTAHTPIPAGKQILIGYITLISQDKPLKFQLKPNLPTKSLGNDGDTQLRSFSSVPKEDSKDLDLNFYGEIVTLAPVTAVSTGVEKLWMKVTGNGAIGAFDYIIYYTLY